MKKIFFLICLLPILTACSKVPLKARLEALTPQSLASSKVGSPDPLKSSFCGQQIVITWKTHSCYKHLSILLEYVDGSHQYHKLRAPLEYYRGAKVFRLLNDEYYQSGGILTYKVSLYDNNYLIGYYNPITWVDWIE